MSIAAPIQNKKVKGQPTARRYQKFRDQHGRRIGANIELKTGDPTAGFDFLGWSAPFMPDIKYLEVKKDEEGGTEVGQLVWNYRAMLRDAKLERKISDDRIEFFAQQIFGEKAGEAMANPPAQLRRYMKDRPKAPQLIVAAMKGDPWVLGFEKGPCPDYLKPYFHEVVVTSVDGEDVELELDPEFVAAMEARFEAVQIKKKAAPVELAETAEAARQEAAIESQAAARATAARKRGH